MTTEYNEAETLLTITDSKKWNGQYIFMFSNLITTCFGCIFEKHGDCDKFKCLPDDRKDEKGGYYIRKDLVKLHSSPK